MLRPALELAWAVAKAGSQIRPGVPAPGRLRPLLRFAKLPDRALSTLRQVVDEDDEFRERVARVAEETDLGRAGWLWLVRPDGWVDELATLAEEAGAAAAEQQEEKDERSAKRRLRAAEAAAAKAAAEADTLRQVNAELLAQVTAERQARRAVESRHDDVEASRQSVRSQQERTEARIAGLESQIAALTEAGENANRRITEGQLELEAALSEVDRLQTELRHAGEGVARLAADYERLREAVEDGVRRATVAARSLDAALSDSAKALGGIDLGVSPDVLVGPASKDVGAPGRSGDGRSRAPGSNRGRRSPVPLPPAVFDDSTEAAHHLVRVRGMLLIVDGYNVTLSSWPGAGLGTQRHRLVDALAELVVRTGASVQVVFDGTDGANSFDPPAAARRKMRVTFSASGVEADEVIIDMVDKADLVQPITVATDDRRVRHEVSRRGASVISVTQLLAVLGRIPDTPSAAV
jgi:predicted RNA-binding protein with PIN domain